MTDKQRLVIVLQQISKRYSSIFFSKMVLLEQDEEPDQGHIRHYDIQCEAVQSLTDTLATKIKAIKFKAFYSIKFHIKEEAFKRKPKNQNSSYVKNLSSASFYDRNGIGAVLKSQLKFSKTSRYEPFPRIEVDKTSQMLSDIDMSMSALMKKMRKLNNKFVVQNQQDPETQEASQKMLKRKLILSKLNQLENNLEQLIYDESRTIKSNHITTSHVTLRYDRAMGQRNFKSTRQINRTFCAGNDNY